MAKRPSLSSQTTLRQYGPGLECRLACNEGERCAVTCGPRRSLDAARELRPLSRQSLAIVEQARALTGDGHYVFPSLGRRDRPLSENTPTLALRRMGFPADVMTAHGFRAMASTLLNESGKWSPDAIERALAHKDGDQVRAAYHRGAHWQERVAIGSMVERLPDALRAGGEIVPFHPVHAA